MLQNPTLMTEHDQAISKETAAQHEAQAKEDAHRRAQEALAQKKAALDNLQKNVSLLLPIHDRVLTVQHTTNEASRENKLHDLHGSTAAPGAAGTALGDGALDRHYAEQGQGVAPGQTGLAANDTRNMGAENYGVVGGAPTNTGVASETYGNSAGVGSQRTAL